MRSLAKLSLLGAFAAMTVAGVVVAGQSTASADDFMKITKCPVLTATKWVNPNGPIMEGTRYQVNITGKAPFTCAQATAWVRTWVAQHTEGGPAPPPLKGGPAGFTCRAAPDRNGHAYQGNCLKNTKKIGDPLFTWGPP
jgi:hypothetical protein